MYRPLIGLTCSVHYDERNWKFDRAYDANVIAIEQAGGLPVLVPSTLQGDTLRAIYERLDGVLLPGGGDVDPEIYHAQQHAKTILVDRQRDESEMQMTRWAVAENLPVFGICRGHQVFNVALGGTLVQDIPSSITTDLRHDIVDNEPRSLRLHHVDIAPQSKLADVLGATRVVVNSLHHQSIEKTADGLLVTAYAPDGVIEAVEVPEHPFALTVQWHPEDMIEDDEAMRRLFRAFVEAAANRHA